MNVAMVHYHLSRGGVTQTIANHLRALDRVDGDSVPRRIAVVHGGRRDGWPHELSAHLQHVQATELIVEELDYDERHVDAGLALGRRMEVALRAAGFEPADTVVHLHNATIGKSASLPGALVSLARAGFALIQQIHDFAEDFRPENYRLLLDSLAPDDPAGVPQRLYPQAPHIHYAVLNGRDTRILSRAGVPADRLHLLPNPVFPLETETSRVDVRRRLQEVCGIPTDRRLLVYPVRIIRRKNLGEALLWSALAGEPWHVAVTQAPRDGVELECYAAWKRLAQDLGLPATFEIGLHGRMQIEDSLAAADRILTTSIAEGFGMAFLEAWLAHRPVVGRDLPDITRDFVANGVRYRGLADSLQVPFDWIGREAFRQPFEIGYARTVEACGRPSPTPASLADGIEALVDDGRVDFVRLSTAAQREIVQRVHRDAAARRAVREANPWIADALESDNGQMAELVTHNEAVVRDEYALEACGRRLSRLYAQVAASPRDRPLSTLEHGERILDAFLSLDHFHPFRVEDRP